MAKNTNVVQIMNLEQLTKFAEKLVDESGETKVALAEKLSMSRQVLHSALTRPETKYTAPRLKVLDFFGYEVDKKDIIVTYTLRKKSN